MDKKEALIKIKELKKFVEEQDKQKDYIIKNTSLVETYKNVHELKEDIVKVKNVNRLDKQIYVNRVFSDKSVFGSRCVFIKCKFGSGCEFGPGCEFGSVSEFGPNCEFGSFCEFGSVSEFGSGCEFDSGCTKQKPYWDEKGHHN